MKYKAKLLAIIGLLASIVGIFSFFTGKYSIVDFFGDVDTFKIEIEDKYVSFSDTKRINDLDLTSDIRLELKYPYIKYEDNTYVEGKINKLIKDVFSEWDLDTKNIQNSDWYGEVSSNYQVIYKIKNLIGIRFEIYWYGTGAAHGNTSIRTLNVNLENGSIFEFKDLFRSWCKNDIDNLIKSKLEKHECYCISFDDKTDLTKNDREFYFKDDMISIVFLKYEIACGACGPIEVMLELSELVEFINPNGPLKFFL